MDYFESAEGVKISFARAVTELGDHGFDRGSLDYCEFLVEFPLASFPRPAQDVLAWLGY